MKKQYLLIVLLFPLLVLGQSADQNYIKTTTYKKPVTLILPGSTPAVETADIQITYFDGLGRPIQERHYRSTDNGKDLVTPIVYDAYGRQVKKYLAYPTSGASLNYDPDAITGVMNFYKTDPSQAEYSHYEGTNYPYSETAYEASPLNRPVKQSAPGDDWRMDGGHEIRMDYLGNATADAVKIFKARASWMASEGQYAVAMEQNAIANYPAGQLYKTITKDENWSGGTDHTTAEFKNKDGKLLLKRNYTAGIAHDTYYVYDQYGNLSYVIPPLANGVFSSSTLTNLCYQYQYDDKNRMVSKKMPGKQTEFIVYDLLDRVVATGPSLSPLREESSGWLITKYDAFNRPILTGWLPQVVTTAARKTLQDTMNNQGTANSETKSTGSSTVNGISFYYSNTVYPTSGYHVLGVNYYDDYNFPGAPSNFTATADAAVYYNNTTLKPKGLPTGSWTRNLLGISDYSGEVTWMLYDIKSRVVRNYTSNNFGKYTQAETQYDFIGNPLQSSTVHKRTTGVTELKITEKFTYTPQGRLFQHRHQVNALPEELLVENHYDDLGAIQQKRVGGVEEMPLQDVDYNYTIRGWLKDINPVTGGRPIAPFDLFRFKISYNTVDNGEQDRRQYNGNIAATEWLSTSDGVSRKYSYHYDALNRLTDAYYSKPGTTTINSYNENILYDQNGNIRSLKRNGGQDTDLVMEIDDLVYSYNTDSNQLMKVEDNSNSSQGFTDSVTNTENDYGYDADGNLKFDRNKGITAISYNHLNLPTKIIFGVETRKIEYFYDALGKKLLKKVTDGAVITNTDYLDGFQYKDAVLQFFPTAEGYVNHSAGNYNYIYHYTDHLGNVRLAYTKDATTGVAKIVEENNYYPFGLKHTNYNSYVPDNTYNYKYNGKELQEELGLNMYDYGARNYDPALGRWMNMDPLAESSRRFSPYTYALNNPVYFIDPDGMKSESFVDIGYGRMRDVSKLSSAMEYSGTEVHQSGNADDNGYNKNGQKINDNGGDKTDYLYDDNNSIVGSRNVAVGELNPHENFSATGRSYGYKPQSGAIEEDNIFFELLLGEAIYKTGVGIWGAVFGRSTPVVTETGMTFGERLFLSENFGVTSTKFGSSAAKAQGTLNKGGGLFKAGWSTGQNAAGEWGYKFRIGIGTSPLNSNIARFHMYIPKSFVSNSFANPSIEVKRSIFHLIKTFK